MEQYHYTAIAYGIVVALGGVISAIRQRYWPRPPRKPNRTMMRLGYGFAWLSHRLWQGLRGRRQQHSA
jgi:hypothetical protein